MSAVLVMCVGCTVSMAQENSALSADQIIQKAVKRASQSRLSTARPSYSYTKVNVTEQLDTKGNLKERKERVFQVSFRGGATSVKLLEVNGHSPAAAELKFQADTQSSVHQFFGQPNSGGDSRENLLTPELAAHFDFSQVSTSSFNGRPTYEIRFQPKNPLPPVRHLADRLLNRISGTLWIDAEEYEIARADIQLGSEVDLLGGVIGCLRKLVYTMTRTRVAEGVWLHSFSAGDFEGRKLLDSMRIKIRSESTNFRLMASAK